jgi:hypothetical protein
MSPRRLIGYCCVAAAACLGRGPLRAQPNFQGVEFRVNVHTVNSQYSPSVAVDADGDFIITWIDAAREISGNRGIYALRFNSSGTAQAAEFHVNTFTTSIQAEPSVVSESNGDFVVVWQSLGQDGSGYGVFGQRFTSNGTPIAGEFQINTFTTSYQQLTQIGTDSQGIAMDSDGDFVVAWESQGQDGGNYGVFARRFNSSGTALAIEFQVNVLTSGVQKNPAVALDSDGDFVIVFEHNYDGNIYGIFGKRFNSSGAPLATQFQVNSYTTQRQDIPDVAMRADGDFIVTWQSNLQDGGSKGIFARRFTSAGTPVGVDFQVSAYTIGDQRYPEIAADDSGDFVVAWESIAQDGHTEGVFARRVSGNGAFGPEFRVNTYTFEGQRDISADWDGDGDFVVTWYDEGYMRDGSGSSVFAQRFKLPPLAILDIDGNGLNEPLTDGLLNLRHRFGFTGTGLTNGAIAGNCTRCVGGDITAYLNDQNLVFDIDNNGVLDALTDGLLILRFLFGFTGTSLTGGAVAGNCSVRCDASTITPYLQALATP